MLELKGRVINVLKTPDGVNSKGESFIGKGKVQIMFNQTLRNGETRMQLQDVTCEDPEIFRKSIDKEISIPVGIFARGSNVYFFVPRDQSPSGAGRSAKLS